MGGGDTRTPVGEGGTVIGRKGKWLSQRWGSRKNGLSNKGSAVGWYKRERGWCASRASQTDGKDDAADETT